MTWFELIAWCVALPPLLPAVGFGTYSLLVFTLEDGRISSPMVFGCVESAVLSFLAVVVGYMFRESPVRG
jgi:hypothetical protein